MVSKVRYFYDRERFFIKLPFVVHIADLQQKLGHEHARVLMADEPIRVEGGTRRGQDLWKLFAWCVLGCLLLEKLVLAWPMLGQKKTTT